MQPVEEFRYLVLAAQREEDRMFTEALRPLGLTPSQAEVLRVLTEKLLIDCYTYPGPTSIQANMLSTRENAHA